MKIYSNNISNTNFRGDFDKYAYISQKIINARIAKERSRYESNVNCYNEQLYSADRRLSSLKGRIRKLKNKVNQNEHSLSELRTEGNEIIEEVRKQKELVKDLSENNPQLIQKYYELKNSIQNDINKKTTDEVLAITNDTQKQCDLMETGLKNQLIKKVINPILQYDNIPSSVYIENSSGVNDVEDKIATWLCDITDATHKSIDATSSETPKAFINNVKKLLLSAYRNFEENGRWTMLFIDNVNSLNLNEIDKISPDFLNKILKSCSKFYHSSIVAMSDKPVQSLGFSEYLKLDKFFVQDSKVGLMSLAKDLIKKKI